MAGMRCLQSTGDEEEGGNAELRRAPEMRGKAKRGGSRLGSSHGSSLKALEAANFQGNECGVLHRAVKCWVLHVLLGWSGNGRGWQEALGRGKGVSDVRLLRYQQQFETPILPVIVDRWNTAEQKWVLKEGDV